MGNSPPSKSETDLPEELKTFFSVYQPTTNMSQDERICLGLRAIQMVQTRKQPDNRNYRAVNGQFRAYGDQIQQNGSVQQKASVFRRIKQEAMRLVNNHLGPNPKHRLNRTNTSINTTKEEVSEFAQDVEEVATGFNGGKSLNGKQNRRQNNLVQLFKRLKRDVPQNLEKNRAQLLNSIRKFFTDIHKDRNQSQDKQVWI